MASARPDSGNSGFVASLIGWFDDHERPLPWRASTPWGVLVSEFMLQQTPVDRVLPAWGQWMDRWPTAPDIAAARVADALRAWGRLGYPRRALWLHQSAVQITEQHGGQVPIDAAALRALPGVGEYTAAAVQAFAYKRRSVVLDTNVRRVLARVIDGRSAPAPHVTAVERTEADLLWPADDQRSARWSAAVMEFGALVCTARRPACGDCPLTTRCAWTLAGQPSSVPARRQAGYAGSDRQARGRILSAIRESPEPVGGRSIERVWPHAAQRDRALATLISDGLVRKLPHRKYALPD